MNEKKEQNNEFKTDKKLRRLTRVQIIVGILVVLATTAVSGVRYVGNFLFITVSELIFTMVSPLSGTGTDTVSEIVAYCAPLIIIAIVGYTAFFFLSRWVLKRFLRKGNETHITRCRRTVMGLTLAFLLLLPAGWLYIDRVIDLSGYLRSLRDTTTIYEEQFADPLELRPRAENPRNLILIYLESMETTYASPDKGGIQEKNLIPRLTALAEENVNFSFRDGFGGHRAVPGTTWTTGAFFATQSGLPFAFPITNYAEMGRYEKFAGGTTTLGDILRADGYDLSFYMGWELQWGGYDKYTAQHGDYRIYDVYSAQADGTVPEDYYVWWGMEDLYVFEAAKRGIAETAKGDQPFFTIVQTMDTHFPDGYECALCDKSIEPLAARVVDCADRQVADFVEWCMAQDFYENTTIIILGDHPRMDTALVEGVAYSDRPVYNCFIHSAVEPQQSTFNRSCTTVDMFPTIMAAIGYEIPGDRLGIGTDLFSSSPTLAEEMGYAELSAELAKSSPYFTTRFA